MARVKVLNDEQWRPPMDSKYSSVAPTTESNLSSSMEEIQPWPIYGKGDDKGSSSAEERLLQTARFYFAFQRIVFFTIMKDEREREGSIFVDEMDFFFFFNFLSHWMIRKDFFLIMIAMKTLCFIFE